MFRIRHWGDIAVYTGAITTAMTLAIVGVIQVTDEGYLTAEHYAFAMRLAIGLPLAILPPILVLVFYILRTITTALDKIENFVKFDALTKTLARSYLMDRINAGFATGGALLLVDADHFKKINDGYGHDVGDETLSVIGQTLNAVLPDKACAGRIGGEEFAIFLPGAGLATAEAVAALINGAIRDAGKTIGGKPIGLTVSIGIALALRSSSVTHLFKDADEALYEAKTQGRDRAVLGASCGPQQSVELAKVA